MTKHKFIEIQGHRGARGLFPENTITSFIEAVKLGVDAIELDVVISKDRHVVVSHEPFMNGIFCSTPDGFAIAEDSMKKHNLYCMNYDEIKQFDCGKRGNYLFPSQKAMAENKPLLSDVVNTVDEYTQSNNLPSITYNIEIKSELDEDNVFQPTPDIFVDLVYNEIKLLGILSRTILQSFDVRILNELNRKKAEVVISYLVENTNSLETNLSKLNFKPHIYAPEFILINEQLVQDLKHKNITLITWTVNEINDMQRLIKMGVSTIITDYPDRAINLIKDLK